MMERLAKEYSFLDIIPIAAINNEGINELEDLIKKYLPENEHIYGEEAYKIRIKIFL